MSLRWKIALALAGVALLATTAVGIVSYRSTASRLIAEVDHQIEQAIPRVSRTGRSGRVPDAGILDVYWVRVLSGDGEIVATSFEREVPAGDLDELYDEPLAYARSTQSVDGEQFRVHSIGVPGGAVQVARSLDEVDRVLDDLRRRTALLVIVVSLGAALVGWVIASGVAGPLRRLTSAAEEVGASGEFDVEVEAHGSDEVGRLTVAFSEMLDALSRSRTAQQRLVDDAGHELRTPLTSLRTNLAVLRRHGELSEDTRGSILSDLDDEVTELTSLVNELVAVAGGERLAEAPRSVDLGPLVNEVAGRVSRRRDREVVVEVTSPATVEAEPAAVDRAVTNLIDNACKFDQTGGPIEVRLDGGAISVLDRGPGIPAEDAAHVFDRFYRADTARTLPGSGLGLAIDAEMAARNDGEVFVEHRAGGGAIVGFRLPPSEG
ncbi:MAG: HAMP domain-containing sensor histidine kinase [Acidimicrobiia bacterium]|nr:HAMP domain-containing sensor histidine kinase [Acidimicrobiia bacterium]